ncbi:DNA end binding protein, partial [Thalassiosira pseudonana CCMP1335]
RSPVVSIMGHVDHGKTTLMDALRRRAVTTGAMKPEAGGITQVITAFEEENKPISTVTFLDTPGHAAFKKMRQSGSSATDVIVLVVAADDGVSPQTVEIIEMFKSIARSQPQSISLVVAVSKIDKPGIDVDEAVMRIENQLIEHEILTENVLAGGGDEGEFGACQLFPVSGITGDGLDDLIEGLGLQSEIMDLRADEEARGEGIVIDARMEKGLGVVADCVIRWGKVEQGDFVVSGTNGGRVKFLNDVANKPLKRARPSQPVRIVGFKTLPKAGDPIVCAASEDEAKELIRLRESELMNEERADFEADIQLQDDDAVRIPVVIKADSHGALEAVRDALVSIGTDSKLNIVIDPVEMSTGVVTTSDVRMARESDAAIFVFGKVGIADKETKSLAESEDVSIRGHDIIYRLLEDAKEYFGKYLPVEYALKVHGKANVQAVFEVTDANKKEVSIAGLRVSEGTLFKLKVLRKGEVIASEDDKLKASSLRKVKEDVDSVRNGEECGLGIAGFNDLKEGDVVECYSI